ncbi:hypothetical protein [Desulfovibrio inopinatus]|uniref:hypothetical protein n=1 Tax=Desulfovibrio inopinatus TaxID=102109 RepID=UPI00041CF7BB|nr:hypothetical protein [Desulfovibrio inopinatus]
MTKQRPKRIWLVFLLVALNLLAACTNPPAVSNDLTQSAPPFAVPDTANGHDVTLSHAGILTLGDASLAVQGMVQTDADRRALRASVFTDFGIPLFDAQVSPTAHTLRVRNGGLLRVKDFADTAALVLRCLFLDDAVRRCASETVRNNTVQCICRHTAESEAILRIETQGPDAPMRVEGLGKHAFTLRISPCSLQGEKQ